MAKRLFISYAWESEEYRLWVRRLSARFREDGVDARIDHWHLKANDNIPEFMSREVRLADLVLVLCSPAYQKKVRAAEDGERVSGVSWETRLLTARMLVGSENKVLAALARGSWAESAPDFLAGQVYYDLSNESTFSQVYRELLQRITGTFEGAPPLGGLPTDLEEGPIEPLRVAMDSGPTILLQKYLSPFRLVYTRITAEGVLDWDLSPITPYDDLLEAAEELYGDPRVTSVFYLPETNYFKNPPPNKRLTAITAICCLNPESIASGFRRAIEAERLEVLGKKTNKLEIWQREKLFSIMAAALGGAFIVSVALPHAFLWAGRGRPEISYRAVCGIFLVPLVELHRTLRMEEFHLRIPKIGGCTEKLKSIATEIVKNAFPRKGRASIDVVGEESSLSVIVEMADHISWAVERMYRQPEPDKKWIKYFEQNYK